MQEYYMYMRSRYIHRLEEKIELKDLVDLAKMKIDPSLEDIPLLFLSSYYDFLCTEPYSLWNEKVAARTFEGLQNIYNNSVDIEQALKSVLTHFLISYACYKELIKIIEDLSFVNDSPEIKTRMYRIPTYNGLIEGCLTNLYKSFRDLLDLIVEKDLKSQTRLNGLYEMLVSNGYPELCENVDVDLRNAINHGGIFLTDIKAQFYFYKKGKQEVKEMTYSDFDRTIENLFDDVSGMIVAYIRFFSIYPDIMSSIETIMQSDTFIKNGLIKILLSLPGATCGVISESPDGTQLNMMFNTRFNERGELVKFSIEVASIARAIYPSYDSYFVSISNERMLPGWARYSAIDLDAVANSEIDIIDLYTKSESRGDVLFWEPNNELLDLDYIKYHRFPITKGNGWRLANISDCSTKEFKRLKADLFIEKKMSKKEYIRIVNDSIRKLKSMFNPPTPQIKVKHGDIPADSIYLNVYLGNIRIRNKSLFTSNNNFLLYAEYNSPGVSFLKNGGLPDVAWVPLLKEHIGNILYAWNPNTIQSENESRI
ncbi:hypothetical protein [Brevibacillus sp. MS2.2]|uniref:hypothetical protein n=1 Tax=Brevibacillus sp. MS2.2 TaxID=2738981 RepID=UPI00156AD6CE|nr:hypothetical protein [Brevibacillus sp. MS2.2]NRR20991.1 hypothetical protein [Brevibacillus sp. MS2.2]